MTTHLTSRFAPTRRLALLASALALAVGTAHAHGPTRQKVEDAVTIQAPAAKVWALIKDVDALKNWYPNLESASASDGAAKGSVRTLKFKGGGELVETIQTADDEGMRLSLRAKDGGALPVSNYTSHLKVTADGDKQSKLEWRGAFYRAYPNNDPPPDQNDEAAIKAVSDFYKAGLANLKKLAEAQ